MNETMPSKTTDIYISDGIHRYDETIPTVMLKPAIFQTWIDTWMRGYDCTLTFVYLTDQEGLTEAEVKIQVFLSEDDTLLGEHTYLVPSTIM